MPTPTIAVLHGDQTGEELLREALRFLDPSVLGFDVETRDFDLSLAERRRSRNQVVLDAADALRELGYGIKAATITPEGSGDVGSPNAILRKQIDGRIIVRTGRRIPATYALLLTTTGEALVIPALNRDGDTLSDLVMQMFGTIAGAESTLLAFDDAGAVAVAMTEAPHGTAPALEGKNVANPMAMIMAVASLLGYMTGDPAHRASRAIYEAALEAVSDGVRTADLGGQASTTDFTAEVVRRVKTKVDVWSALADIER